MDIKPDEQVDGKYDPLTGRPIPVFFHYAIPSVVGLLAASSASIIDAIFLGNYVGAEALAAVNLVIPVVTFFIAVVFMLAAGGSVIAGKLLGEQKPREASEMFSKTIAASMLFIVLAVFCILPWIDQVVRLLGANDALAPMVKNYLQIISGFAPLMVAGLVLNYFVVLDNQPMLAGAAMVVTAVLNIVLDWLFIVELGFGVTGAAWATGLAQVAAVLILLPHIFSAKAQLKFVSIRGSWRPVAQAAFNGISEFTNEMSVGIITLMYNWVLITRMGTEGLAAFTVVGYMLMAAVMVYYGFSEALQPTVSKNLGAGQINKMKAYLKIALAAAFGVGAMAILLFLLVPEQLIGFFLQEGETQVVEIALVCIALMWPAFLFNGVNITATSYLTALHRPIESAVISLLRSLLLPALLLFLLPRWLGDDGIFIVMPLTELLTLVVALGLLKKCTPREA